MLKNGAMKSRASFRAGNWCRLEDMVSPDETHQADGDLLPVHPMRAKVRRVVLREGFEIFPKSFCVLIILREMERAAKDEGERKAGGFPEKFNVVVRNV